MKKLSLKKKALLGTTLIIITSSCLLIFFIKKILFQKLAFELQKRGVSIAKTISEKSINYILTDKLLSLKLMTKEYIQREENLEYIFFLTSKREVLVHSFPHGFPIQLLKANKFDINTDYNITHIQTEKGMILNIGVPILNGEAGFLYLGLSEEPLRQSINAIIQNVLFMNIFILVLGGSLAVFYAAYISRPIFQLAEAAKEVGKGNLNIKVNIKTKDEIGYLGTIFNKMIDDLNKTTLSFRTVVETALDAIVTFDIDGKIILWNKAAEEMFGYGKLEALGKPVSMVLLDVFQEINLEGKGISRVNWELTFIGKIIDIKARKKNKKEFPVELSLASWMSEHEIFFTAFIRDISRRKQDEKEIGELSGKIINIQEEERANIADHLHDNFGQSLSALKILLSSMMTDCLHSKKMAIKMQNKIMDYIDQIIEDMRKMSHSLSPLGLKNFGLETTTRNLIHSFHIQNIPKITLNFDKIDELIEDEKKINIFRIIQEALTNIIKHANAKNIVISVEKSLGKIIILIIDNGKGITQYKRTADRSENFSGSMDSHQNNGLGLLIMKERAKIMHGELKILSNPNSGTEVKIEIPI